MSPNPRLDAAIAAAAQAPEPPARWRGQVTLASGKVVGLDIPADITPLEVLHLVGFLSTDLHQQIRGARKPSRILTPV